MNYSPAKIRLRQTGKLAKTTYVNEVATAVNGLDPSFCLGSARPAAAPGLILICKITDSGPNGEAEPTDETYWAQVQYILSAGDDGSSPIDLDDDQTLDTDQLSSSILLVTNLPERGPGVDAGNGTHLLRKGTLIEVRGEIDEDGIVRFVAFTAVPLLIPVDLTYSAGADGTGSTTAAYTYTAKYAGTSDDFAGGAALTVTMQRPNGKTLHATTGFAWWNGSAWVLRYVDEVPNQGVCSGA